MAVCFYIPRTKNFRHRWLQKFTKCPSLRSTLPSQSSLRHHSENCCVIGLCFPNGTTCCYMFAHLLAYLLALEWQIREQRACMFRLRLYFWLMFGIITYWINRFLSLWKRLIINKQETNLFLFLAVSHYPPPFPHFLGL